MWTTFRARRRRAWPRSESVASTAGTAHSLDAMSVRWLILVVVDVVAAAAAADLSGRYTCPPPEWWLRIFLRSGNYGCVQ